MASAAISMRFIIFIMLCMVGILNNFVRSNMSFVIVAMTKPLHNTTEGVPDYGQRYEWTAYEQSLVIGSYFWGQILMATCAAIWAGRYGSRHFVGFGMLISMLLYISAPASANFLWLIIILNFLIGFSTGTISPGVQSLISNWAPPEEKGKFQSTIMANGFGVLINWSISGFIIEHFGWHYAFYVTGTIHAICAFAWYISVYYSPSLHPKIKESEKVFILTKLNKLNAKSSKAKVHHLNITTTGLLSSIPYLIRFPIAIAFGSFSDFIFKKNLMKPNVLRKGFSVFSHFIPACCLIGLMVLGTNTYGCVTLITIAIGANSALSVTSLLNPHDLSPNFAVTIFGFIQTIGSSPGFLSPMIVAYFTNERNTEDEWYYVFATGAGILTSSAIIFILFGSVQVQKWNEIKIEDSVEKEELAIIEYQKIEK